MVGNSAPAEGKTPTSPGPSPTLWYAQSAEEVARIFKTGPTGLSSTSARKRLTENGPNSLSPPKPVHWLRVLTDQVRSLVVLLLIVVFVVAVLLGDYLEAAAVGAVLAINISIGFATELRARRAMEALSRLQVHSAVVIRDGAQLTIDAREVVPGDVIVLAGGEAVPADARVLEAAELEVNEAPLTGESLPTHKHEEALPRSPSAEAIPLADRSSMVYKGTMVSSGDGLAYVVGTGAKTEIGRVSELIHSVEEGPTPLERKLAVLGRRLIWATLTIAGVITGIGIARGREPALMIETGLALAIAAVPEGLPVVATIALAVGLQRMARRRALVRRLSAVEGLGSATVVCADKTGTLTTGRMTVTRIVVGECEVSVRGAGMELAGGFQIASVDQPVEDIRGLKGLLESAVLANRASVDPTNGGVDEAGDPTEVALLVAGLKAGLSRSALITDMPERGSVPFSSERMMMATFHQVEGGPTQAHVKGAPSRIIDRSSHWLSPTGVVPLDERGKEGLREQNRQLSGGGLRVLAVARRTLPDSEEATEDALHGLTFLGLVGISDPPADRVQETLSTLETAGIATIMITGDQAQTAEAVAREIGLLGDGAVLSAPHFDKPPGSLPFDRSVRVFARVSPGEKLRIVEGLQRRGEVVAMIGDGINDAPALKQADIGVAMGGRGTDVAKETADLVLQDDRFETIGAAVEQGRVIFENIRKFVFYLFSCNLSEVGVLSLAAFTALPPPLLPLQILWLNLITDVFPALALAMEPAEADVMERPPRDPASAVMSRAFIYNTLAFGALLTIASGGAFLIALLWMNEPSQVATTVAFQTLALSQLLHVFNARTIGPLPAHQLFTNPWIVAAVFLTLGLQVAAVTQPGLMRILSTASITRVPWGLVLVCSALPLLVGQLWKRRTLTRG